MKRPLLNEFLHNIKYILQSGLKHYQWPLVLQPGRIKLAFFIREPIVVPYVFHNMTNFLN